MNLDSKIELIRDSVMDNNSLSVLDENTERFEEILSDISLEAERISGLPMPKVSVSGTVTKRSPKVNYQELLKHDGDDFIINLYRRLLNREPDEAGFLYYKNLLESQTMCKDELIAVLGLSQEACARDVVILGLKVKKVDANLLLRFDGEEFIEKSFLWLLGRKPDTNGKKAYMDALANGAYKEQILYGISKSAECQKRNTQVVGLKKKYLKASFRSKLVRIPVIGKALKKLYGRRKATKSELIALKKTVDVQNNRIDTLVKQLANTDRLFELQKNQVVEAEKIIGQISQNIQNNNVLIEKHDKALDSYTLEDKILLQNLAMEMSKLSVRVNSLGTGTSSNQERTDGGAANVVSTSVSSTGTDDSTYNAIDYFDFENHFRGSREHIKEVQKIYLKYFEGRKNVLDLGCGRGEFTEMLLENNVGVTGVDIYEPYVEFMKMQKLPAVCDGAAEYLRKMDKVDGIFLGQVVEHIPVQSIIEICNLAYEKLEEGAYLIMETPNPMSLAIFTECFYMDPSHKRPVHPKTLQYLAQKAGFESVEILFTDSSRLPYKIPKLDSQAGNVTEFNEAMERVENLLYGSQDYAIIARK